jgi:aminotransferase EvaB
MNDLSRAFASDRASIEAAVNSVLESGWYIHGEHHGAFEQEFATYLGVAHCIGVANGTDALVAALSALDIGGGARVCLAANAGFYGSTACLAVGARPHYVDVDLRTATLDLSALRVALETGPDAVIYTHLYGDGRAAEAVASLCREFDVPLIEDCAQATGARIAGKSIGTFGTIGCFSFYPTKNLAALGDAGAVVSDDPDIAERLRRIRQYGWVRRYEVSIKGFNSRLDEIQAAVLRVRLQRLDERNERRREILRSYASAVSNTERDRLLFADEEAHVGHLAVIMSNDRQALRAHLQEHGVSSDFHYPIADDAQAIWRERSGDYVCESLSGTQEACSAVLSVPLFPELTGAEVEQVSTALRRFGESP